MKNPRPEALKKRLFHTPKDAYATLDEAQIQSAFDYCEGYKDFINSAKTEREFVKAAIKTAEEKGFKPLDRDKKLKPGDRIYLNNRNKSLLLAVIGTRADYRRRFNSRRPHRFAQAGFKTQPAV